MPTTTPSSSPASDRSVEVPTAAERSDWDAWGTEHVRLPAAAKAILTTVLAGRPTPIPRRAAPTLTASRIDDDTLHILRETVGAGRATREDRVRMLHLGGKSTPDLLRRRLDDPQTAPDAVVSVASHEKVLAVLAVCHERGIAVVPFGGGTSVVGGVEPERGAHDVVIALDLAPTAALLDVDELSLLATFGAGTTGPQAEELLSAHGFTLGHFPQSFEYATIGGFAATRSSGQASRGYGRFDDLVHALRIATPVGDLMLGRAPASAAGPDLRELFLGSEGAFGVITEVTVRVRPVPAVTRYGSWTFPDFDSGAAALRELTQLGIRPTVLRLSDKTETRVNAAMGGHVGRMSGCLAVATFEGGSREQAQIPLDATATVFARHGAKARGEEPARSWERGRFSSPALRDTLLDAGVLAETLETATTWTRLQGLKAAVTEAVSLSLRASGTKPVVLCHISHVYPAGASLYFTVVAAMTDDPLSQWNGAKDAASRAIGSAHATITHHHAVGRDHRPYLQSEIGPLGVQILRAVKDAVDPKGIMNPGALVPPRAEPARTDDA
jgi:alkyldihydroxyacetonephosphate synthase